LIYVGLGEENGGIVLNLGEDGLEFHAALPLHHVHLAKVRFQLPVSGNWTELSGEVAWANDARTLAGIRFIGLKDEARGEIRGWIEAKFGPQPVSPPRQSEVTGGDRVEETVAGIAPPEFLAMPDGPEEGAAALVGEVALGEEFFAKASPVETGDWSEAATQAEIPVAEETVTSAATHVETIAEREQEAPSQAEAAEEEQPAERVQEDEIIAAALAANDGGAEPEPALKSAATGGRESFAKPLGTTARDTGKETYEWTRPRTEAPKQRLSSWAISAMILIAVAGGFAAGFVVGRGWLNQWIASSAEQTQTKTEAAGPTSPQSHETAAPGNQETSAPRGGGVQGTPSGAAQNPALTTGKAASAAAIPSASSTANPAPPPPVVIAAPDAGATPGTVELQEEPISASATIAMSATRSVEVPPSTNGRGGPAHVLPGEMISHVEPDYPVETIQEQVEGTVKLRVTLAANGTVKQIEPMGGPPALVSTSVAAVREWRYRPTLVNGRPVEVQEVVSIVFRLPSAAAVPANR